MPGLSLFEAASPWAPSPTALGVAVAIDLCFGELPARLHPVVWMGRFARGVERALPSSGRTRQLLGGAALALLVPLGSAAVALGALALLWPLPWFSWMAHVLVLTAMFAIRALGDAARAMRAALDADDVAGARRALGSLCSRDASALGPAELAGASIESVAENASDSVVAPLFYYAVFGLPGAVVYRAVNTLDAMVGYRGRYEYFGKASARFDDVLNFIPARLTALLLLGAGGVLGGSVARGMAIWRRDGASTESPNAGRPMAVMAGLLGVRLEKAGHYDLGDADVALTAAHIEAAWRIVQLACLAAAALVIAWLAARHG